MCATQFDAPSSANGVTAALGRSDALRYSSDLSDEEWALIRQLLPPQKPRTGRPALDHRTIVNAILWVKCNGYPWRDLPARYGKWSTAASRYHRWTQAGIWQDITTVLAGNASATPRRYTFSSLAPRLHHSTSQMSP
jgi:transposase